MKILVEKLRRGDSMLTDAAGSTEHGLVILYTVFCNIDYYAE